MKRVGAVLTGLMLSASAAMIGGCATLNSGSTQYVRFQSSPEDVVVTMIKKVRGDGPEETWHDVSHVLGKTPFAAELDKEEGQSVVFSKEGYKPVRVILTTTLDSWFWGNLVFGGPFGSTTDNMSGAMHEYSPSQYFITLTPSGGSLIENATLKSQRDKAREFIVGHYSNLMTNLSRGGGEDLTALLRLLHLEAAQEADAHRKIRALSEVYTDIPQFADHVTDLYLKSHD